MDAKSDCLAMILPEVNAVADKVSARLGVLSYSVQSTHYKGVSLTCSS